MAIIEIETLSREDLVALQVQVAAAIAERTGRNRTKALAELEDRARELGFTLRELTGTGTPFPMYCYANPDDSNQIWCGRGRRPRWFTQAMAAGRRPEDLMI
ncbi:H-NS histone family protein [Cereibacter sphaeroides]|uniref:H-NS histone family protein n=1 Tax=Cereibacter sphaeroides TaxID=1063 RepID=UPI001F330161|nr:H-NS histone family protein [Cereibacter sphaeroides]MCE6949737.1 H-NS histone family protein [Cereibacter sphaeroides]